MSEENVPARIERAINRAFLSAAERYADNTVLRTVVVSIPQLGGGIDMILTSEAQRASKERVFRLLEEMRAWMEQLEADVVVEEYLGSEEFIDLVMKAFDSATKTRDEKKIRLYARILTESTVRDKQGEYFPEEYLNVLASLTPKQVEVAWTIYAVQGEPRESVHPEGSEGWHEEKQAWCERTGLHASQLIFMLKGLVAVGLVAQIGRNKPGTIAVEYSITPSFKEMMEFLESTNTVA